MYLHSQKIRNYTINRRRLLENFWYRNINCCDHPHNCWKRWHPRPRNVRWSCSKSLTLILTQRVCNRARALVCVWEREKVCNVYNMVSILAKNLNIGFVLQSIGMFVNMKIPQSVNLKMTAYLLNLKDFLVDNFLLFCRITFPSCWLCTALKYDLMMSRFLSYFVKSNLLRT